MLLAGWLPLACGGPGAVDAGRSLSTTEVERAGEHCPLGGQRILTGIDANADGALQPGELLGVAYVCNGQTGVTCSTIEGSVVVRNALDWTHLVEAGCTRVTGTLEITADGASTLGAPSPLRRVGALLVTGNDRLERLAFPDLATVDDGVTVRESPALEVLALPSLASVGAGGLSVQGEVPLLALDLPALSTLGGPLVVEGTLVSQVLLPLLAEATQGLVLRGNPGLVLVHLPALAAAPELLASDNLLLDTLALPALASVAVLQVDLSPNLNTLSLPALVEATGWATLVELQGLRSLDLGALAMAGDLTIDAGAALPVLSLPALRTCGLLDLSGQVVEVRLPSLVSAASLRLGATHRLQAVDLPALAWLDQDLSIIGPVDTPAGLTALALPSLVRVGAALRIERLAGLTSLDAPALREVGTSFSVVDDPALPRCLVEAIVARLRPPLPAVIALANLDDASICAP
jgi:hypothetical protein